MKKRIAIIGHFGADHNILDGQTIKTRILYDELKRLSDWDIDIIDTFYKKEKPFALLLKTLKYIITTRDIIVLLSGNGMRFYFPILSVAAKVKKTRVYHDVIGGNLDQYVDKYPQFVNYLNSFKVNWVETEYLKNKLVQHGIHNCVTVPNFKRLRIHYKDQTIIKGPYRFCMFSRVMKEKGIETAIEAVEAINKERGAEICTLDIYGRIDENYEERFTQLLQGASRCISYLGTIDYDKSTDVLENYYALLFPSYWHGEGFPGTIVDAFSAGIPVIATDWNSNAEIVENGINGVIYPSENIPDLKTAIEYCINNEDVVHRMKKECNKSASKYQPDLYIEKMIKLVEEY